MLNVSVGAHSTQPVISWGAGKEGMAAGFRRWTSVKAQGMSAAAVLEGEAGHAGGQSVQTPSGMISSR